MDVAMEKVGMRRRAPNKLLIQETEDEFCNHLKKIGYEAPHLKTDLHEIKKKRFKGEDTLYINYLMETTKLLEKLNKIDKNLVVKDGCLLILLNPPTQKLELGEFYLQAGLSEPGTLAIKFGKLNHETQKLEQANAKLDESYYTKCARVEFFKEFRDRAMFAGDCLFRLCYVKDNNGRATKRETKHVFAGKSQQKQRPTNYEAYPMWPQTVYDMDQTMRDYLIRGLERPTTLPGKNHLSFARKLNYSQNDVLQFDKSDSPSKAIVLDMVMTFAKRQFSEVILILEQMDRIDIIQDLERHARGVPKRRGMGKAQSLDDHKIRTNSSPPAYHSPRGGPVENSDEQPCKIENPPYPSMGGALGGDSVQTEVKALVPSNSDEAANSEQVNRSYPTLSREMAFSDDNSDLDSISDMKRHMQPEGDLSLVDDDL